MRTPAELAQILPTLPRLAMKSHAYRVVDNQYLSADLSLHPRRYLYGLAAPAAGARFTPRGGAAAVYMADELATAFDEANPVQAIVRKLDPGLAPPTPPGGHASILYQLESVLDLTDPAVQAALGTSREELIGPWRQAQKRGRIAAAQRLGQAVYDSGAFQAIWYESARVTGAFCMAVFLDRLASPAYLEVFDPHRNVNERVP